MDNILTTFANKVTNYKIDISETSTIFHIILPLFEILDWKLEMIENIIFEISTKTNQRIDIKFTSSNKNFLLEAKRFRKKLELKDFEQLTTYLNGDSKTDIGILTNGLDYWIADNRQSGGYEKKLMYKFSLETLSNCDIAILKNFQFPLDNLGKLVDEVKFQKMGKKLNHFNCESLIYTQISEKNTYLEKFKTFEQNDNNFTKFFTDKIILALKFLESKNHNLDTFYKEIGHPFSKTQPKNHPKLLKQFNIYLNKNSNSAIKQRQLKKIEEYLEKI